MTVRVVVADDEPLVRAGLSALLGAEPGIEVVAGTDGGPAALTAAERYAPDVVLLDLATPGRADMITRFAAGTPVRVLAMTAEYDPHDAWAALSAGAAGLLLKTRPPEVLRGAVRAVAESGSWLDPIVVQDMLAELSTRPAPGETSSEHVRRLTARETEVLVLLANGLNSTEIAQRLFLSMGTVRTHVGRILMKLHCRDRTRAVVVAYRTGLVRIPARDGVPV